MASKQSPHELANTDFEEIPDQSATANIDDLEAEEEFHTDPEDQSADEEDEINHVSNANLLPLELLRSQPAATTLEQPRAKLTSKEQRKLKLQRRAALRKLRSDTSGTGVLEAGRAAQAKRGLSQTSDRVRSGRVGKKRKPEAVVVSGRQRVLEQRMKDTGNAPPVTAKRRTQQSRSQPGKKKNQRKAR